jgi:hypothetical protein
MGNYNPNYFDRKSGSLERAVLDAVNGVRTQIDEKVSYVEYKFKNKQDAMKAKLFYDGLQRMGFEVNDDNINGGELMVDAGKNDMTQYHKQIMQKYKPKVMTQEKMEIDEKVSYVEYKFKNKQDAMKAKLFYDGLQRMGFEVNDDNINGGELMVDAGKNDMTQYHKQIMQKYKPKVMTQEKMDAVGKEDGDIDNDGDKDASDKYLAKRRKAVSKAIKSEETIFEATGKDIAKKMMGSKTMKSFASKVAKMKSVTKGDLEKMLPDYVAGADISKLFEMENYDVGTPENTKAKLDATPGQSSDEWNQQVEMMQKKNMSMREALAKVWGFDEGKNPFEKNIDEKKEMGFKVEFGKGDDAGMAVYRDKKDAEAFAKRQPKPIKITKGMYDRFDEEDKTLTGKPMTKVSVDPKEEKKN